MRQKIDKKKTRVLYTSDFNGISVSASIYRKYSGFFSSPDKGVRKNFWAENL